MKVTIFKRIIKVYMILVKNFGTWISGLILGKLLIMLRLIVNIFMFLDYIFFPSLINKKIKNPIIIVGNPRSEQHFFIDILLKII